MDENDGSQLSAWILLISYFSVYLKIYFNLLIPVSESGTRSYGFLWKNVDYHIIKKTPWPEFASELYRPSDRRLSEKVSTNFCG
jgi:hypothetical protein